MLISSNDILEYIVFNENDQKLGKVSGYILNSDTLTIEQIFVRTTSILHPFASELTINRTQIIRIESKKIIVDTPDIKATYLQAIQSPLLKTIQHEKAKVSSS